MEEVTILDIPPTTLESNGNASPREILETIEEAEEGDNANKKRTPSLRGSARFARTKASSDNEEDVAAEMAKILITQPNGDTSLDDSLDEEFHFVYGTTADDEYDTDLEMDIDQWLMDDKNQIYNDFTGEKTYLSACEHTGVTPVTYFIRHIEDTEVIMRFRGLGPLGAKALSVPLKKNNTIEKLNLEGNWIEMSGCTSLADTLAENIYISDLILSENRVGNEGVISLCDILIRNDYISKLDLSGNVLTDVAAESICDMLKKNTVLKHLIIRHNYFEEKGALHFKEALSTNESLETLDLSWNRFRTKGAVYIAEGIMENFGLRCLNFAMNGLSLDGAVAMGKALKNNRTLLQLDLSFNRIPEAGAANIACGLQTNDTLQGLKISSNPIGTEGAMVLLMAVERNDSCALNYLEMFNIRVSDEFEDLQSRLIADRDILVLHAGVNYETTIEDLRKAEPDDWWIRDPMTKLRKYIKENGYRLIDLFKDFDKDGNQQISREEFILGVKQAGMLISDDQIEELIRKLDKDKNGQVDFGELLEGEREYKKMVRQWMEDKEKLQRQGRSASTVKVESARDILEKSSKHSDSPTHNSAQSSGHSS